MTARDVSYAIYPSLDGVSVFVTGGADGIGRALVLGFAAQGSRVGFADIDVEKAHEAIALTKEAGVSHPPLFYEIDLVHIDALRDGVAQAQRDLDGINVLVNDAANDERHDWKDMTVEYWNDRLNTNLRHYFFAIQAVAPRMIEDGWGSIVNIGSSSYMMQEDFFPGYAIAKSGVEGITRTMARTFGPHNIRVNTVLPGWVATERQLALWWTEEGEAQTIQDQAIKRRIYPEEFVQLVLFLAADNGAACTAQSFLVDGGRF